MNSVIGFSAAAAICLAGTLNAGVIDFTNNGIFPGRKSNDYSAFETNGFSGTLGAFKGDLGGTLGNRLSDFSQEGTVTRNFAGLGIRSQGDATPNIDARSGEEILVISFDRKVRLVSVSFGAFNIQPNDLDDYDFFYGIGDVATKAVPEDATDNPFLADGRAIDWFAVKADNFPNGGQNFRVASATVEAIAPVPLPGTLGLMAGGAIAIGALCRKKRRAT